MEPEIVFGLGNPGNQYTNTYHNVGLLFLDAVKAYTRNDARWLSAGKLYDATSCGDIKLVRPKTFMNESGKALQAALSTFDAHPSQVLVVHDDHDLPFGSYKFAEPGTGTAGHRGVESIIHTIGNTFPRLRIGISKTPAGLPHRKAERLVLQKMSSEEKRMLESAFKKICAEHFTALGGSEPET